MLLALVPNLLQTKRQCFACHTNDRLSKIQPSDWVQIWVTCSLVPSNHDSNLKTPLGVVTRPHSLVSPRFITISVLILLYTPILANSSKPTALTFLQGFQAQSGNVATSLTHLNVNIPSNILELYRNFY